MNNQKLCFRFIIIYNAKSSINIFFYIKMQIIITKEIIKIEDTGKIN